MDLKPCIDMKLLWFFVVFLFSHWRDVSSQLIPSGTCDCATFARNNIRPKRPLVTWPAGETSCSASSVARCRVECNKFFRTFEFDALDLVCGSLHEASRVQILFGYRICKSKWRSLGLSEEPICCRKSRPIHCDSLEASRRQNFPHIPHSEISEKIKPQRKKISTSRIDKTIHQPIADEESTQRKSKKTEMKPRISGNQENNTTRKTVKKNEKEETTKKSMPEKTKDKTLEETKAETATKHLTEKRKDEVEGGRVEDYEEEDPGIDEEIIAEKNNNTKETPETHAKNLAGITSGI